MYTKIKFMRVEVRITEKKVFTVVMISSKYLSNSFQVWHGNTACDNEGTVK